MRRAKEKELSDSWDGHGYTAKGESGGMLTHSGNLLRAHWVFGKLVLAVGVRQLVDAISVQERVLLRSLCSRRRFPDRKAAAKEFDARLRAAPPLANVTHVA